MSARVKPRGYHPVDGADYSVEVIPNESSDGTRGTRLFDVAPWGWSDSYDPRRDEYLMQGPWDRIRTRY